MLKEGIKFFMEYSHKSDKGQSLKQDKSQMKQVLLVYSDKNTHEYTTAKTLIMNLYSMENRIVGLLICT